MVSRRGLKIARLYKRNISGRVTLQPGTELTPVSFNKRQQNEETFFQKHSWRAYVSHHCMVHPLSWCDGLSISMTQRAMPAGAYAPGRVTHAGQVEG